MLTETLATEEIQPIKWHRMDEWRWEDEREIFIVHIVQLNDSTYRCE